MGEGTVESLTMKNLKFIYGHFGEILVIFNTNKEDDIDKIKNKIKRVGEIFLLKYGNILPSWDGNYSAFDEFNKDVDEVIKSTIKIVFMGPAGVGKTTICNLIKNKEIQLEYNPTIGLEINSIKDIAFNEELQIMYWDLGGQRPISDLLDKF
ncbi:MAG: Rab family GTPase [Candidatus Helarchaeota archaeon]